MPWCSTSSGAAARFSRTSSESSSWRATMIDLGEDRGCPTTALLTAMDRPLGRACGNALETEEAILALRGEGPPDLMEVTYALGVEMLLPPASNDLPRRRASGSRTSLGSGLAAEKFEQIIEAQGGNPRGRGRSGVLPQAQVVEVYRAPRRGVVARVEPGRSAGRSSRWAAGGRRRSRTRSTPPSGS